MIDLWYKNAIIYCLDVETFMDSDADGVGDFAGLSRRLDYIAGLGATCIWLLPFYPSPNRDNGYDVADYYGVDHRLGTLGDFVEFVTQARERGLRVIIDLVVNHTSDQHPWFREACRNPRSIYRDYYVWSETKPADAHEGMVFPGVQDSVWSYSEEAGLWYLHRFFNHQPDLNIANPAVREEIRKIMGFWLALGVSGFRLDAAPFVIEQKGIAPHRDLDDPHLYLRDMRRFLSWRRGDAIMLAEANIAPDEFGEYFGSGDRLHMLFNFIVNQHLFLALARGAAEPLIRAFRTIPEIPDIAQWANFLRNHDELDLGRLSDRERREAFAAFGPDPSMQLYDRGIRRRLAPMLDGDQARLRLAYSLMLTLPGTPVLWYGDEIGMGDDLSLAERTAVRTPMQWSGDRHAGFSERPGTLPRPVIADGPFAYPKVNVARQDSDPASLLNWMAHAIRARRESPEFGWGAWHLVETEAPGLFAHRCDWQGSTVIAVHNLSAEPARLPMPSDVVGGTLHELFCDRDYGETGDPSQPLDIDGFGYRWLRMTRKGA